MKKSEVKTGQTYRVKVSGSIADVRITSENANGGWDGVNVSTNRNVRIKSARRLRGLAKRPAKNEKANSLPESKIVSKNEYENGNTKPTLTADTADTPTPPTKNMSLLDTAAHILTLGAALPMRCQDIVALAIDRSLWMPGKGKTPASTLYAAIHREIKTKGNNSRFRKAERGKFEINLIA